MTETINAVVAGDIFLPNLHPKPLERLRRELMYPNPEYRKTFITKQPVEGIEEWLDCLVEGPDGVHVPRGAVGAVKKVAKECGIEIKFEDRRSQGLGLELRPEIELRSYQSDAAGAICEKIQGVVVMPCGAGKTRTALAAVRELQRSTLILVHTNDLLDQWVSSIQELFGESAAVGTVADGKSNWGPITVAMMQTLSSKLKETDSESIRGFGICIIDEAHHVPCSTLQSILPRVPAKWRIGLSATPQREDGLTKLIQWSIGDIIHETETAYLIKKGWLVATEIREIQTEFKFTWTGPDRKKTAALSKAILQDEDRNGLIVSTVTQEAQEGRSVLVLSNNKAHCKRLGKMLLDRGVQSVALMGSKPRKSSKETNGVAKVCPTCNRPVDPDVRWTKKGRKATLDQFRSGEVKVVLATSLADEALDIPRLDCVVLAMPGASRRAVRQQLGRSMRPLEGKKPVLYDFVDGHVDSLVRRAQKRKSVYREMGLI